MDTYSYSSSANKSVVSSNQIETDVNRDQAFRRSSIRRSDEPLLKRPLDILLSFFMLLLSAPISLLIAIAIKLEDGGPVFYRQERWGRLGKRFTVFKFR